MLRYDSATGKLYWRERCSDLFNATESRTAEHSCRRWNSQYANKEAFTYVTPKGYKTGCIFGQIYLAHRVIWAMQTGAWPVDQLDHVSGSTVDNRLINLRDVSNRENARNSALRSNNTSGVVGVNWNKSTQKWKAQIRTPNGVQKHLGYFSEKCDAIASRKAASLEYGYHKNHGRAAL